MQVTMLTLATNPAPEPPAWSETETSVASRGNKNAAGSNARGGHELKPAAVFTGRGGHPMVNTLQSVCQPSLTRRMRLDALGDAAGHPLMHSYGTHNLLMHTE